MTMPNRPDHATSVAVVIPLNRLHEGREPVVVRRPGRPRRVEAGAPSIVEAEYHRAVGEAAAQSIREDEVVVAATTDDPMKVVDETMNAIARESAALLFEREKAVREGRPDADKLCVRRTNALLRLADLTIARAEMERELRDPKPEQIATIVGMLVRDIEDVVEDVAPVEIAATFVAKLDDKLRCAGLNPQEGR